MRRFHAPADNRGVPIYAIARHLQSKGFDYLFNQADEENVIPLGGLTERT